MSLTYTTEEAARKAKAAKRNSSLLSLGVALLINAALALLLLFVVIPAFETKPPSISPRMLPNTQQTVEQPEIQNRVQPTPSAPSQAAPPIVTTTAPTPVTAPVVTTPTNVITSFGKGNGLGLGTGGSGGLGSGPSAGTGQNIPREMKGRCTNQERLRMIREAGGDVKVEDSILASLRWLAKEQEENGSWDDDAGFTGLALLCYTGHCETINSPEFGTVVDKAIAYLVGVGIDGDGLLAADPGDYHYPYEHAIATYALAEAYTFHKDLAFPIPGLEDTVLRAGEIIVDGINTVGSWDYSYKASNRLDLSIAGWHLQALKAIKLTGLDLRGLDRTLRDALDTVTEQHYHSGEFSYGNADSIRPSMTAVGVLVLQQNGGGNKTQAREGLKVIVGGQKAGYGANWSQGPADPYYLYYAVQAARNAGGDYWAVFRDKFQEEMLAAIDEAGMYGPPTQQEAHAHPGGKGADLYRTTLLTLGLETYYRFLPTSDL